MMTAQEFRDELKECGLSQTDFAHRLDIAVSTVNRWASGELPVPGYAQAYLRLLRRNRDVIALLAG
jgi:DNA-binding transcriptional regulator YiaG